MRVPLLCCIFGHKWRLPRGLYTIGEPVTYYCARGKCEACLDTTFYIERL